MRVSPNVKPPRNNSVAARPGITLGVLCQAVHTARKYRYFSQSEVHKPVFEKSSSSAVPMRGLERTCVMCVKGCPVEREPASSVPAPYLSLCHPTPPCHSVPLFSHFPSLMSFHHCNVSHFIFTHRRSN